MKCAQCPNPAKVGDLCWWCFYSRDGREKEYLANFGDNGCQGENVPKEREEKWKTG
jgi:hypothetical protein